MRIYTRKGDGGETDLPGGVRVRKDSLRVSACGDIDELNAALGLLRGVIEEATIDSLLAEIQMRLFEAGAELAGSGGSLPTDGTVRDEDVGTLEGAIDRFAADLPPLARFVLPGGSPAACQAHHARCVCRRAERSVVRLLRSEHAETAVLRYLNRLSDFLFVLARWSNRRADVSDVLWSGRQPAANKTDPGEPDSAS